MRFSAQHIDGYARFVLSVFVRVALVVRDRGNLSCQSIIAGKDAILTGPLSGCLPSYVPQLHKDDGCGFIGFNTWIPFRERNLLRLRYKN